MVQEMHQNRFGNVLILQRQQELLDDEMNLTRLNLEIFRLISVPTGRPHRAEQRGKGFVAGLILSSARLPKWSVLLTLQTTESSCRKQNNSQKVGDARSP